MLYTTLIKKTYNFDDKRKGINILHFFKLLPTVFEFFINEL